MSPIYEHPALKQSQILTNSMQLNKQDQNRNQISKPLWTVPYLHTH